MRDVLLHHCRVDSNLVQTRVLDGTGFPPGLDGFRQQPFDPFFADPLPPPDERGGIDRRLVLEERLAGEMLKVRVLHPAGDHRLVREPEGVLQVEQPRHQPR
jgi:hypothetical protein